MFIKRKNSKYRANLFPIFAAVKNLNDIIHPIAAEMQQFESFFEKTLRADTEPMNSIMRYVVETKGKRLRPILVLFSAKLWGNIGEPTLRAATFVEMMHSATLVHDDVVDCSDLRRGRASVKAHFDDLSAVLAGDYLLAKAILLIADNAELLKEVLNTSLVMSEGELMQDTLPKFLSLDPLHKVEGQDNRTNEAYLDIITRKTAMLMRSCCFAGATSVDATQKQVQQIAEFGLNFGILFQLRDDILDNENTAQAKALLPVYYEKTLQTLKYFPPSEIIDALSDLTAFCAEREE